MPDTLKFPPDLTCEIQLGAARVTCARCAATSALTLDGKRYLMRWDCVDRHWTPLGSGI